MEINASLVSFVLLIIGAVIFGYEFVKTRTLGSLGLCLVAIALALLNLPA